MRLLVALLLLTVAVDAQAARAKKASKRPAKPEQQLTNAERAFEEYDYQRAAEVLQQIVNTPTASAKVRQRAWLFLGFSRYYLHDLPAAKSALAEVFDDDSSYALEREMFHPDLVKFYDEQRAAFLAARAPPPAPEPASQPVEKPVEKPVEQPVVVVAPVVEPPTSMPVVITPPPVEVRTLGDRHPWLRIFPIIGHFANYDRVGGGVFLALELVLIGMNVGGAVAHSLLRYPEGDYRPGAFEAQIIQNVGGVGAIAVGVICIIDAFAGSPKRGRAAYAKSLAEPVVNLGPLGDFKLVFR